MKVLHLFSDRRKTGPADPVLAMCRGIQERGHEVLLAYRAPTAKDLARVSRGRGRGRDLENAVTASGVPATTRFALNRYMNPIDTLRDMVGLPRFLRTERFDIVHTHLRHDQFLGLIAARLAGPNRPRVITSLHHRDVLPATAAYRGMLRRADGVMVFTPEFRRQYIERFGLDERRVALLPMTIDAQRLDPQRPYKDIRAELGIPHDAVVIGIVGRFQQYRKMEVFMAAARRLVDRHDHVRFLVIGASRSRKVTVRQPTRQLGLEKHVVIAGYRGPDYIDCLAAMDIFTLLMPGSDGTARAVREAMAMGKPCVVSDYGMLPEIVPHGRAGLVASLDHEGAALAKAWSELVVDADRRRAMGSEARRIAVEEFDPTRTAGALEQFYQGIMALPRR